MYLIGFRASIADEKEVHHLNIRVSTVTSTVELATQPTLLYFKQWSAQTLNNISEQGRHLQFESMSMQRPARN